MVMEVSYLSLNSITIEHRSTKFIQSSIFNYNTLGSEVALFVAKHFIKELKKLDSFKRKDYRVSLQETFLKMD